MDTWKDYVTAVNSGLDGLAVTDVEGEQLGVEEGFGRGIGLTRELHAHGHIYLVGNGASAAMASHFAADACKNAGLRALTFNDAALLTCVGNDLSFEEVFAQPLSRLAGAGDMLIAISSSGQSPDILRALQQARDMRLIIVTLSGRNADNPARKIGDLNFYLPTARYGWIESGHHVVLHYWLDQYLDRYGPGAI
jgi:D-sedoheptulose 7-phosphate isomerase